MSRVALGMSMSAPAAQAVPSLQIRIAVIGLSVLGRVFVAGRVRMLVIGLVVFVLLGVGVRVLVVHVLVVFVVCPVACCIARTSGEVVFGNAGNMVRDVKFRDKLLSLTVCSCVRFSTVKRFLEAA